MEDKFDYSEDIDCGDIPEKIHKLIENREYLKAAAQLSEIIDGLLYTESNDLQRELLYELLDDAVIVCDKVRPVAENMVPLLVKMLDSADPWVKTSGLLMVERIGKRFPDLIPDLSEQLDLCLGHPDSNIRELAVHAIGRIIINSGEKFGDMVYSIIRMINDDAWRVRNAAIETAAEIIKKAPLKSDTIMLLMRTISAMCGDPDGAVQGTAVKAIESSGKTIPPEILYSVIESLLKAGDPAIYEKGIWLWGELSSDRFEVLENLASYIIGFLRDENPAIRIKAIDAAVKAGRHAPDKTVEIIYKFLEERGNEPQIYSGLKDIILYLSTEHPSVFLPRIFGKCREFGTIIRKFNGEIFDYLIGNIEDKFEEEIAEFFGKLDNEDWEIRKNAAEILGNVIYLTRNKRIGAWIYIKLNEHKEDEDDPEVKTAISDAMDKIRGSIGDLDNIIAEIRQELDFLYGRISELQNIPERIRTKILDVLEETDFRELIELLNTEIDTLNNTIKEMDRTLFNYTYRRLAVDLIEDWTYIRLDITDQLNEIREYLMKKIEERKKEYLNRLKEQISKLRARIDVLRSDIETLAGIGTEIKELIMQGEAEKAAKHLEFLSYIRDKIYRIEADIGELWINNLDFKDELKELTVYWVDVKIEGQQLLATIDYNLKDLYYYITRKKKEDTDKISDLNRALSFELLITEFQQFVLQANRTVKEQYEKFDAVTSPIEEEIKNGNYENAEKMLELAFSQVMGIIEQFDGEIKKKYEQLDEISSTDLEKSERIRNIMRSWENIKDALIEKANTFRVETSHRIFIEKIKEIAGYMNPIPLQNLSSYLKIPPKELADRIFNALKKGELEGKIIEDKLYLPEAVPVYNRMISVARKLDVIGDRLKLAVRIKNETKYFLHDAVIILGWPDFLYMQGHPERKKMINLTELPPEHTEVFNWTFRIVHPKINNIKAETELTAEYKLGRISLIVKFIDMFGNSHETIKTLEILKEDIRGINKDSRRTT